MESKEYRLWVSVDDPCKVLVSEGSDYYYVDGIDINELRLPREPNLLEQIAELIELLLTESRAVGATSKMGFQDQAVRKLLADLALKLPLESKIKKLTGAPLLEALDGFLIVPESEWQKLQPKEAA
jgi:hypothetical protein